MKIIKTILMVSLMVIYEAVTISACLMISIVITLLLFGNSLSTPSQQVNFTWWSVVVMFVLTFALFFLWMIVDTGIRKRRAAKGKLCFV